MGDLGMGMNSSEYLQALGRLLANEDSASDLLALLVELDDRPLSEAFDLSSNHRYELSREVAARTGRLDAVVFDSDSKSPVAVLEMKGASDLHGDQLDRYLDWANSYDPKPELFLCAFDNDETDSNPDWTRRKLKDVFSPWKASAHKHASWLAKEIVTILDAWDREAEGPIGKRTGYYVSDILTKRLARDVQAELLAEFSSPSYAGAHRDNGGSPMTLAWTAHPRDPSDDTVVIGVDLRSPTRRSNSTKWKLRPFLQVDTTPQRGVKSARTLAFELAWGIREAMGYQYLSGELGRKGQTQLSEALSARNHDGFNKPVSDFDFQAWAESINGDGRYPRTGAFFHDKGRRLATILDLEVKDLTRQDLASLVVSVMQILVNAARAGVVEQRTSR